MKKIKDKQQIKNIIHYLIKWADWLSEYNFYKSVNHLADALKAVVNYKCRFKYKCKKISWINVNNISDSEDAFCKQTSRWNHMSYSVHSVLNEAVTCFSYALEFWSIFEWIILHLIQSATFFTLNHSWSVRL